MVAVSFQDPQPGRRARQRGNAGVHQGASPAGEAQSEGSGAGG